MSDFMRSIPITPDMVSLWVPSGLNRAQDLIRGNHGQCYGTHPNVPVIGECTGPNLIADGGMNIWASATDLTYWSEALTGTSTVNREATEKIEGAFSCRLDVSAANNNVYIFGSYSMIPLKRNKLTIWYKNSAPGKTFYFVLRDSGLNVYLKEDGTWNVGSYSIIVPNSTVWTPYELEFNVHEDYSNYRIDLRRNVAHSSSIYFDNVSIREVGSSTINPSVGWVFGGDDYVDCGNDKSLAVTGDISIVGWVYISNYSQQHAILAKQQAAGTDNQYEFAIVADTGKLRFVRAHATAYEAIGGDVAVPIGQWTQVGVTQLGTAVTLYINRSSAGTGTISLTPTGAGNCMIGTRTDKFSYLNGYIALLSLANKGWSQQQFNNFGLATKGMFAPRG